MNTKITLTLLAFMIFSIQTNAQQKANYGSNRGRYVEVQGIKLYYEEYGAGVPLLLLHGGLSSIRGFSSVIPELSKHFRVIAVDAPGQGRSEQSHTLSFKSMASHYSEMIDKLGLDSVYVYGFSLGGITALHLAANRPDKVKMVVAHSAVTHLDGYNEGFGNSDQMTTEEVEKYADWWLEGHRKHSPQPDQWKKFINDLRTIWRPSNLVPDSVLQQVKAKSLILLGDSDIIHPEHAIKMRQKLAESHLCILPGTTHFALWENPQDLLSVILSFLQNRQKPEYQLAY